MISSHQENHHCAMVGCLNKADYKAPSSPNRVRQKKYLWFCLDHIRLYNKSWNYARDFDQGQIEDAIRLDLVGQRPTWYWGGIKALSENRLFSQNNRQTPRPEEKPGFITAKSSQEIKACYMLEMPLCFNQKLLKKNFTLLAKKHHPDMNAGEDSRMFKIVHQAYTRLKTLLETHSDVVNQNNP